MIAVHPLLQPPRELKALELKTAILKRMKSEPAGLSGGFFDDLFDTAWNAVTGLYDALEGAIQSTINTIAQLGETLALVVRAAIGDVSWSEVLGSLGKVFQDIGAVLVYLNPARMTYQWLKQSPLTAHAFNELDKFTGGMITSAVNVSDLPWRAMRGDPISKQELLRDALFIIQVVAIVVTGPVALGVMVGTMVGRQVCSKQTEAKDACMVAFQIAGAATGSWASAYTGVSWGGTGGFSQAEQDAWLNGDEAYKQFLEDQASLSFGTHLNTAAQNALQQSGIDIATQQAVVLCQTQKWAGRQECSILGQIANDYLKSDDEKSWEEFLADEVAKIGAEQLMLQWFPPGSKERRAIEAKWNIRYVDVPVDQTTVVKKSLDPKTFLLLAGGAALALIGVGS